MAKCTVRDVIENGIIKGCLWEASLPLVLVLGLVTIGLLVFFYAAIREIRGSDE